MTSLAEWFLLLQRSITQGYSIPCVPQVDFSLLAQVWAFHLSLTLALIPKMCKFTTALPNHCLTFRDDVCFIPQPQQNYLSGLFSKSTEFWQISTSHVWLFLCSVNEGGVKQVSNYCPDPGEPENGKRIGSDFRLVWCFLPDTNCTHKFNEGSGDRCTDIISRTVSSLITSAWNIKTLLYTTNIGCLIIQLKSLSSSRWNWILL